MLSKLALAHGGGFRVLDIATLTMDADFVGTDRFQSAREVRVSPDGQRLAVAGFAVAGQLASLLVINLAQGAIENDWPTFDDDNGGAINSLSWSPDGTKLAVTRKSGFTGQGVSVVDTTTKAVTHFSAYPTLNFTRIVWSGDGTLLFGMTATTPKLHAWNLDGTANTGWPSAASNVRGSMAADNTGTRFAFATVATTQPITHIINTATKLRETDWPATTTPNPSLDVDISGDGTLLGVATYASSPRVNVFTIAGKTIISGMPIGFDVGNQDNTNWCIRFSDDATRLWVASADGTQARLRLIDVAAKTIDTTIPNLTAGDLGGFNAIPYSMAEFEAPEPPEPRIRRLWTSEEIPDYANAATGATLTVQSDGTLAWVVPA
jgi:WD40 repeat protein